MQHHPPKWAMRFLEITCSSKFLDELEGDLLELFERDIESSGIRKAKRRFIWKVLLSPRWYRIPSFTQFQSPNMYKSHFKVAFRHALRHQSATMVQALGFTLGLAAVCFIGLYLKNELAFDRMHENRESLYRVLRVDPTTGERGHATSSLHGARLKEEFPFISMTRYGNDPVKVGEIKPILIEDFYWADSTFFQLFSFTFLHGDPASCLREVNSVVITESLSRQLFGIDNALGRSIPVKVYDGNQEFLMKITGIVKDPPKQTHIQFQALGSMANAELLYKSLLDQWGFSWLRTYVYIPDSRLAEVKAGIPNLIEKYFGTDPPPGFGMGFQPFQNIYLYSQDIAKNTFRGNIRNLHIFGSIGILVLLISLLNYINLATAKAITRAKEVGIRKTLGSRKSGIIGQFIIESILFTLSGGVLAVILVIGGLSSLNTLLDLDLSLSILSWTDGLLLFLGLVAIGIIAGILPSLVMARIPIFSDSNIPVQFKNGQWSWTRKSFVGIQYLVSIFLLISTFTVYKQYLYLKHFDLGFDSEQLLHLSVDDRQMQDRLHLLKEKVMQVPGIIGATATGEDLPSAMNNTWGLDWNGSGLEEPLNIDVVGVDQAYFDLLGIDFQSGRNFIHDFAVDSAKSVILNERALEMMGVEDVIGQQVNIGGVPRKVIGIVKDHHNTTLHAKIIPLAYFIFPPGRRVSPDNLLLKMDTENIASLIPKLEEIWSGFSPDPFQYNFVDEAFALAYNAERRFSALVGIFTFIAVVISMVGLFGLVSFMVQLKLKEISIRRVLGASSLHLMRLLSRDFFLVFLVALVFAVPLAWYFIDSWLLNYSYHISLNSFLFMGPVLLCLTISAIVIGFHLYGTTRANPSEVLAKE